MDRRREAKEILFRKKNSSDEPTFSPPQYQLLETGTRKLASFRAIVSRIYMEIIMTHDAGVGVDHISLLRRFGEKHGDPLMCTMFCWHGNSPLLPTSEVSISIYFNRV